MKYCREMFLKSPPPDSVSESQLLDITSEAIDDDGTQKKGKKSRRRAKLHKTASLDDSSNWVTDDEDSSNRSLSPRSRRRILRAEEKRIQFKVIRRIFEAQSQEVSESQLLDITSKAIDDEGTQGRKSRRREKLPKNASLDDSSSWETDDSEESSDGSLSPRRRRRKLRAAEDRIQFTGMRRMFEAQSQDVKDVIYDLYKLHLKQQSAAMRKIAARSMFGKKSNNNHLKRKKNTKKAAPGYLHTTNVGFSSNIKILASIQRRRRHRGKPRSKRNCRKKFPRRRRRANAKKGNRQGRKRYLRAQRLFDKGIFLAGRKLLNEVWQAVKDPNATATTFCNNNTHGLSKIHKKQIELYERIEDDLHRLDTARHERAEAALERKAKEQEKETSIREGFKNKIEARAAERAQQDGLKKQRKAARKLRALEKKSQREKAKCEALNQLSDDSLVAKKL